MDEYIIINIIIIIIIINIIMGPTHLVRALQLNFEVVERWSVVDKSGWVSLDEFPAQTQPRQTSAADEGGRHNITPLGYPYETYYVISDVTKTNCI